MIKKSFIALVTAAICILSLLAGSGTGQAYGLYPKLRWVVLVLFIVFPLIYALYHEVVNRGDVLLFVGLVLIIGFWPMYQGYGFSGMEYGFLLLVPFIVGMYPFSEWDTKVVGLVCGAFGFAVVAANLFFGVFEKWNKNDIAMMAFMGSAVFAAAPWRPGIERTWHRVFLIVMAVMVLQLDSRSCFFGIVPLLCLFSFRIIAPESMLRNNWLRRFLLFLPAIIAIVTVLFQNASLFDMLNEFSIRYFGKPIFNGRNTIWEAGLQNWMDNFWFGTGWIIDGYWHNVAITGLTAFGTIGYSLWVIYFENIMNKASCWCQDSVLSGCAAAFLVIMLQQSFELGLISMTGNMLPYLLMGIMLGRMRYLEAAQQTTESKPLSADY